MSVVNGPSIPNSGLVFSYDMNNLKKSFIGAPATNSQWNNGSEFTPWTVGGVNTDVTGSIDQGPVANSKTWKFQKSGTSSQWNGWEGSYGPWTGSAGDIWTTSYWYKTTAPAGLNAFGIGNFYLADWSRAYSSSVLANQSSIIADGQWHYNYTVVQINEVYTNAIIVDGPSWGYSASAGTLFINGLQWNKNAYATPFAAGTRSTTQAILDMTGNNILTPVGLTYSYDGSSFSFNNGLNYIQSSSNCGITGSVTLTAFIKNSYSGTEPHKTVICTDVGYPFGVKLMSYKNTARYGIWLGFGGTTGYEAFVGTDINDNTIKMITGTWDQPSGIVNIYLNGVLQSSISTGQTSPVVLNDGKITIGGEYHSIGFSSCYLGNIYNAEVYNRALSADEVKQIFNANRGRFGL